jgi:hypothetical protein
MITRNQNHILWDRADIPKIRKIFIAEKIFKKTFSNRIGYLVETVNGNCETLWIDIWYIDNLKYAEEKVFFMYNVKGIVLSSIEDAEKIHDTINKNIVWGLLNE